MGKEIEVVVKGRSAHARVYSALAAGFDLDLKGLMAKKEIVFVGPNARDRVLKVLRLALEPDELAKEVRWLHGCWPSSMTSGLRNSPVRAKWS